VPGLCLTDIMDTLAQACCGCFCTSTPFRAGVSTEPAGPLPFVLIRWNDMRRVRGSRSVPRRAVPVYAPR